MSSHQLLWQVHKDDVSLFVRAQINVIQRKIENLCIEANALGKDLIVEEIESCHEDRPTIIGHYCKFKFNYQFIDPELEFIPARCTRYKVGDLDLSHLRSR